MDTGGLARLFTKLEALKEASKLLTYRRNQCDNGDVRARNQSFEWTPVRTGIILGRVAKKAEPLLKTSSVDPQSVYGTAAGCNQEKNTLAIPAMMLKKGNQGIGTCSTRHGKVFALDIGGHKRVIWNLF